VRNPKKTRSPSDGKRADQKQETRFVQRNDGTEPLSFVSRPSHANLPHCLAFEQRASLQAGPNDEIATT